MGLLKPVDLTLHCLHLPLNFNDNLATIKQLSPNSIACLGKYKLSCSEGTLRSLAALIPIFFSNLLNKLNLIIKNLLYNCKIFLDMIFSAR